MSCKSPIPALYDRKSKFLLFNPSVDKYINADKEYQVLLPCRQCVACRLLYSMNWANRIVLESSKYDEVYFLTFTYDDEHVPTMIPNSSIDYDTGELLVPSFLLTLEPQHMRKFLKDLRRYLQYHFNFKGLRFFYVGEYGDKTERPHYHGIFFNLPLTLLNDVEPSRFGARTHTGFPMFESPTINRIWNRGRVVICNANWQSAAYCARYCMKKVNGDLADEHYNGRVKEFINASRMPGIGREFYDDNKDDMYRFDKIVLPSENGNVKIVKPPPYFDRLFGLENPERLAEVKERRKELAILNEEHRRLHSSLLPEEYAEKMYDSILGRVNRLPRNLD